MPLFLLSLGFYCWAWCHMVWNILSASLGQFSWLCPLPTSSLPRDYWSFVGRGKKEDWRDRLDSVKVLLSSDQNTGVFSTLFYLEIQRTALWGLLWGKLISSQSDPVLTQITETNLKFKHRPSCMPSCTLSPNINFKSGFFSVPFCIFSAVPFICLLKANALCPTIQIFNIKQLRENISVTLYLS